MSYRSDRMALTNPEDLWERPQSPFAEKEATRLLDKQGGFVLMSENLPPEDVRKIRSVTVRRASADDESYDIVVCMEGRNDHRWPCIHRGSLFLHLRRWGLIPR